VTTYTARVGIAVWNAVTVAATTTGHVMSELTLYTFCKHEEQPMEAEADLCNKCLPWLGFVPVEPNYEAATTARMSHHSPSETMSPQLRQRYERNARQIVDAALGIGADDV